MDRALRQRLGETLNTLIFFVIAGSTAYGCHQLREKRNNGEFTPFLDDEELVAKDKESLMHTHKAIADRLASYTKTVAATTGKAETDQTMPLKSTPTASVSDKNVTSTEGVTATIDAADKGAINGAPTSPTSQAEQSSTSAGLLSGLVKIITG
ncbi:hypothetical protein SARC_06355 [Sphaeroforma arctica JP610]|uniref:Uncharacterized protein n=1 Tax=Sphaeroforma arctica JP610 TaxID=667725 RepID=A0A0L0FWT3_9EUKA|nr:hypothetical protein SARC_06355 [Sphaeroforma arctica JP610]KNC81305.1 hypothetical protein SARC_06355 [Sphaeroforma arctica JP610]|eukprot:XP_014155207.1 hypothetical protein SARC_06355 [Sphaeroforma arctica JP610]